MPDPVVTAPEETVIASSGDATATTGGCHAGAERMRAEASASGKDETLQRYAANLLHCRG